MEKLGKVSLIIVENQSYHSRYLFNMFIGANFLFTGIT